MTQRNVYSLGVCVDESRILALLCNFQSHSFVSKEIIFDHDLMPGFVTTTICELSRYVDPHKKSFVLGIALNGATDINFKVVTSLNRSVNWIDVPLAAWVSSRINRKVIVCNYKTSKSFPMHQDFTLTKDTSNFPLAFGAGRFALEHFNSFDNSFDAG